MEIFEKGCRSESGSGSGSERRTIASTSKGIPVLAIVISSMNYPGLVTEIVSRLNEYSETGETNTVVTFETAPTSTKSESERKKSLPLWEQGHS